MMQAASFAADCAIVFAAVTDRSADEANPTAETMVNELLMAERTRERATRTAVTSTRACRYALAGSPVGRMCLTVYIITDDAHCPEAGRTGTMCATSAPCRLCRSLSRKVRVYCGHPMFSITLKLMAKAPWMPTFGRHRHPRKFRVHRRYLPQPGKAT